MLHLAMFRKSMRILHIHAHLGGYKPPQNPVHTAPMASPPHNWRSDSFAFHAALIACLPVSSMLLLCKSSAVSALLKNRTTEQLAYLRQNLANLGTSHINTRTKRCTYHFGSTSAIASPPSGPSLFLLRLRVVKVLLARERVVG